MLGLLKSKLDRMGWRKERKHLEGKIAWPLYRTSKKYISGTATL